MPARVLLVDDHVLVRSGLSQLLHANPLEFEVVAEAADGPAALAAAQSIASDLIILDLDLGDSIGGLEVFMELRKRGSRVPALFCSATTIPSVVGHVLAVGAKGYLFKSATSVEALHAVRTVLEGKTYLPVAEEVLRASSARFRSRALQKADPISALMMTSREREVFRHLQRGLSSREVATLIGIREKTIERHRANIRYKNNLSDAEFARLIRT